MQDHLRDEDEHDENQEAQAQPKTIKEVYAESTKVTDDQKDFVLTILKMSKVEKEASFLSSEFHDDQVDPYEAKVKLLTLLDILVELRDELSKTL